MQQIFVQPPMFDPRRLSSSAQIVASNQSWTKEKVKELRGYSNSAIIDKLLDYKEEDLKKIIDYADTLSFTWGSSRICRLAKEAQRQRQAKIEAEQKAAEQEAAHLAAERAARIAAEEAERQAKIEAERQAKIEAEQRAEAERQKAFQNIILDPLKKIMDNAVSMYKKNPQMMGELLRIHAECPQLFDGENVVQSFEDNSQLLNSIIQSYQSQPEQLKSLATSIGSITAVKSANCSIESYYNALPQELCLQLAAMMPWEPIPPSFRPLSDDDILRYYVLKSSKSFFKEDMLVFVVKRILKALLGVKILPIPSVTTVYLFINWADMLALFTWKHYGDKFLSKDKIVAISLSLLAMLLQLLNRETPLSYLKNIYSGSMMAKDFVSKMPADLKLLLVKTFLKEASEVSNRKIEEILSYNIITWNNVLGELTELDNLSMGKTIDMLYTFRVGTTFVDYANSGKRLEIHSLSDYWKNYGPLPNNPYQMEKLFDLFRINQRRYQERVKNIFEKYKPIIEKSSSYKSLLQNCMDLYEELSFLIVAYQPKSYEVKLLYTLAPRINMELIAEIANWSSEISSLEEVTLASPTWIKENLLETIQQNSHILIA